MTMSDALQFLKDEAALEKIADETAATWVQDTAKQALSKGERGHE